MGCFIGIFTARAVAPRLPPAYLVRFCSFLEEILHCAVTWVDLKTGYRWSQHPASWRLSVEDMVVSIYVRIIRLFY